MKLDEQIVDAFSVVSLLIAISAAYLAGIWPIVNGLLHEPKAAVQADRDKQSSRCATYAAATVALAVINGAIGVLLVPLSICVIEDFSIHGPFHTVRAGLILAEGLVASGALVAGTLANRLYGRRKQLKNA